MRSGASGRSLSIPPSSETGAGGEVGDFYADARCAPTARCVNPPVVLDGHYAGGAVVTEAAEPGPHPAARGLVYLTAAALDPGDTMASLLRDAASGMGE